MSYRTPKTSNNGNDHTLEFRGENANPIFYQHILVYKKNYRA